MKPVNAYDGEYEAFEILGQDALFSNFRIDRSTVPDGLYAYDLRDATIRRNTSANPVRKKTRIT